MKKMFLCLLTVFALRPAYAVDGGKVVDNVLYWSGYAAVASVVFDAFSPNWEIQEARFPGNHYQLLLQMKRTYSGGAGEARVVFNRRAKELMLAGGFDGYEVMEYSEGMESSLLGGQRNASGIIRLTRNK
jgi:hypothetical protein